VIARRHVAGLEHDGCIGRGMVIGGCCRVLCHVAEHCLDEFGLSSFAGREGGHVVSVTQDRCLVAHPHDLTETVGDEQHRAAAGLPLGHDPEHVLGLIRRQGRRDLHLGRRQRAVVDDLDRVAERLADHHLVRKGGHRYRQVGNQRGVSEIAIVNDLSFPDRYAVSFQRWYIDDLKVVSIERLPDDPVTVDLGRPIVGRVVGQLNRLAVAVEKDLVVVVI